MAPIPAFSTRLWRYVGEAAWAAAEAFFEDVHEISPFDLSWTRAEIHFARETPEGFPEDRAITKIDLASFDDAPFAQKLSDGELSTAAGIMSTLQTTLMAMTADSHTIVERRWYDMAFRNPMLPDKRFAERGEPRTVSTATTAGGVSSGNATAYQLATSVTFKTGHRRHWGRSYWPGLPASQLESNGRLDSGYVAAVADAWETAIDAWAADGTLLCVPSTQHANALAPALLTPHEVQVDNVPDVIRRRRPKYSDFKAQRP